LTLSYRNEEEALAAQEYILAMDFQERHVDAHLVLVPFFPTRR
jgi:hypothetical protein